MSNTIYNKLCACKLLFEGKRIADTAWDDKSYIYFDVETDSIKDNNDKVVATKLWNLANDYAGDVRWEEYVRPFMKFNDFVVGKVYKTNCILDDDCQLSRDYTFKVVHVGKKLITAIRNDKKPFFFSAKNIEDLKRMYNTFYIEEVIEG